MKKQNERINRYNRKATRQFCFRLNKRTDAEIISKLENESSMQGYVKKLIREDLKNS
jgi:hypothetical protein